jgi:uncharacterized protein
VNPGYVGTVSVDLHLPDAHSLKEKRRELKRLESRLARTFSCAVAEVDHHDLWQRARLAVAVVGRDANAVGSHIESISRALHTDEAFQVVDEARDIAVLAAEPTFQLGA